MSIGKHDRSGPDVEVRRQVAAPPERVWALVSDLPRMAKWSPEHWRGGWTGAATGAAKGARYVGWNRNKAWMWPTWTKVEQFDEGRFIAWGVTFGPFAVSRWTYEVIPNDEGCEVVHTWTDRRAASFAAAGPLATGVGDRTRHNHRNMEATLEAIAAEAEGAMSTG